MMETGKIKILRVNPEKDVAWLQLEDGNGYYMGLHYVREWLGRHGNCEGLNIEFEVDDNGFEGQPYIYWTRVT